MNARVCVCKRERGRERERDSNCVLVVEGKVLNYKCAHYCEVKKKKEKKRGRHSRPYLAAAGDFQRGCVRDDACVPFPDR